jgi:hypothetical protein
MGNVESELQTNGSFGAPAWAGRFEGAGNKGAKLRLLCLHGHGSNTDITQLQIENLRLSALHDTACDFFEVQTCANGGAAQNASSQTLYKLLWLFGFLG